MQFMINFEFGDVVLVPFPFTDQSAGKKRPAVVISSVAYNNDRPDLIIMAVTSQIKSMQVIGEVVIREWQVGKDWKKFWALKVVVFSRQAHALSTVRAVRV